MGILVRGDGVESGAGKADGGRGQVGGVLGIREDRDGEIGRRCIRDRKERDKGIEIRKSLWDTKRIEKGIDKWRKEEKERNFIYMRKVFKKYNRKVGGGGQGCMIFGFFFICVRFQVLSLREEGRQIEKGDEEWRKGTRWGGKGQGGS